MVKIANIKVKEMHCANCEKVLRRLENDLPGLEMVYASFFKKMMVVKYDDTMVKLKQVVSSAKALGYTAELIQ
jgi:copper chaperone CopZ